VAQVSRRDSGGNEQQYLTTVAKNTVYYFRVRAINLESGRLSIWSGINQQGTAVMATATSAIDVVQNAFNTANFIDGSITARKIFAESLAAITANLGIITDGALEGNENNYWALSNILGDNGAVRRYAGDFQVGTLAGDYLRCTYVPSTGKYHIDFKASSFTITALGTEITGGFIVQKPTGETAFKVTPGEDTASSTEVTGGFVVKKPDGTVVFEITSEGEIQGLESVAILKAGGAMTGTLQDPAAAQVRNIRYSITDLTAGSSALATGSVYFVYE
jgi:hypothetical protein